MNSIKEIEKWLNKHEITNYTIFSNLNITVDGNVNLRNKLDEDVLPVKFEKITGYFDIAENNLISLEGCPQIVLKDFDCSSNNLRSLFGAPHSVLDFDCSNNQLTSLSYAPKEVDGFFNCSNNLLTSIEGTPRHIQGYFKCSNNKLVSLKGAPKQIKDYFDCSNNNISSLKDGPMSVGQDYICHLNELRSLDDIADDIGWDVITDINLNNIDSSVFDEENKYWKYKGSEVIKHIYKPVVVFETKEDITKWLHSNSIKDFKILDDNSVDVTGDVRLSGALENFQKLPINFHEVKGNFDISDNVLTSLEGSPKKVHGDFLAHKNELTSLKGGPKEVSKNFVVLKNNITSLQFSPTFVGEDYICSNNPIKSLEGIVDVGGSIFTSLYISSLKSKEFNFHSIKTYKYEGSLVINYLEKEYVTLTEEEKIYNKTRDNLEKVVKRMIRDKSLKPEMINDNFLKNLTKYNLLNLKKQVLEIKSPKEKNNKKELSEAEILESVFNKEI
ncbi:hypothetical protein [Arcobacter arenosus]|uniref:hypothetical protein n=1 Tax=Arcobacter arenosus TaxID=2576037 RepID=UPI003BAA63FE